MTALVICAQVVSVVAAAWAALAMCAWPQSPAQLIAEWRGKLFPASAPFTLAPPSTPTTPAAVTPTTWAAAPPTGGGLLSLFRARVRCWLRSGHNPVRHPLGGFKCADCGKAGFDLDAMGFHGQGYVARQEWWWR